MNAKRLNRLASLGLLSLLLQPLTTAGAATPQRPIKSAKVRTETRAADHVVVRFRSNVTSGQQAGILRQAGLREKSSIAALGLTTVAVPPGKTPEETIADLKTRFGSHLEMAQVDPIQYAVQNLNDPFISFQYSVTLTGLPTAWDSNDGSNIVIAIADTGIDSSHNDLAAHLVTGYNVAENNTDTEDQEGHGTFVASIAGAIGNNGFAMAGAAYNASIMPVKIVIGANDSTTESVMAAGVVYAADHGAKVINVSFAGITCNTAVFFSAADYARQRGALVIQAAGNDTLNRGCSMPTEAMIISATDDQDAFASFSNFGNEIALSAPGDDMIGANCQSCTGLGGDLSVGSGTSFSAPLVAGIAALVYRIDTSFTSDQVRQILQDSAEDLGAGGYDILFGWGRVNASRAVQLAQQRSVAFQLNSLSNLYAYPNPWDVRSHRGKPVRFANMPPGGNVKIFTLSGFLVRTIDAPSGSADWDLTNSAGQSVASGIYYYLATSPTKITSKGKIAVIK